MMTISRFTCTGPARVLRSGRAARRSSVVLLIAAALGLAEPAGRAQTADPSAYVPAADWRQWGGPGRNFIAGDRALADKWPAAGPALRWSRPLGLGHSSIVVDSGRLFTMYRPGRPPSRSGPWAREEAVIALNAETGDTLWEHRYRSEPLDFRHGAGPHATPLVVGSRVFTSGTNKQIHAFDKETGEVLWARDLVREFGATPTLVRPAVKAGYASSALAYRDTIIVAAGGPGQAVMALRQDDGRVMWRAGDFLLAEAAPILIEVDGETQLVVVGGRTINGLDPGTGALLWSHPHETSGDMNNTMPVWGGDQVLVVTSAYNGGTRALRLSGTGTRTRVEELWFTNRLRVMFANLIRVGHLVYGTSGDFGPAFLTALDVRTGEVVWQQRGFGRSSLLYVGDKVLVLDEDGSLSLGELSHAGLTVVSRAEIFDTTSWTAPALAGTTLYARDRERILALDLAGS